MAEALPTVLVPGLNCSARLYAAQIPALWRFGPVMVADHTRDDSMAAIARRILADAPPRFALAGLSMGGYIVFEIMRQAPERVAKIALLDTGSRADAPQQSERRDALIALARGGRFAEVSDMLWPVLVHRDRQGDDDLKLLVRIMADETGPEAFIRQQTALKTRPDSRPGLSAIRRPALVLVGEGDTLTPPELAKEIADGIPGANLVTVPDCGHLSTLERPEAVNRALVEWMEA
jgi:pimeloyl-ACP methyl ester carboxylesterase